MTEPSPTDDHRTRGDEMDGANGAAGRLDDERAQVTARIAAMTGDLQALFEASADSNADDEHDPEGQTIAYERSQHSSLLDRARAHLAEVDAAMSRLDDGSYGRCEVCGEPIPPGRLLARPTARTCIRDAGRRP